LYNHAEKTTLKKASSSESKDAPQLKNIIGELTTIANTEKLPADIQIEIKNIASSLESLQQKNEPLVLGDEFHQNPLVNVFSPENEGSSVYFEDELRKYIIAYQPVFEQKHIDFEYSLNANVILKANLEVIHKLIELMCLQTLHIPSAKKVKFDTTINQHNMVFKASAILSSENDSYEIRVDNDSFMERLTAIAGCSFRHSVKGKFIGFELVFANFTICRNKKETAAQRQIKANNLLCLSSIEDTEKIDATLLIVEQNNELRNFLINVFEHDYKVAGAQTAKDAYQIASLEVPDLIISDVLLPDHDGFWLQQQLSRTELTNHIPLLFLTALISKELEIKALSLGSIDLVTKPFDASHLILKVRNILHKQLYLKKLIKQQATDSSVTVESKQKTFIEKLNAIIEGNIANTDFSVTNLAHHMALSERQLLRKLKAICGRSPSEHITEYRLKAAEKLLTSGYSITQVVENCGFTSNSYFSKSFKATYGESPSKYVKRL